MKDDFSLLAKSLKRDLNSRPTDYESVALPSELLRHVSTSEPISFIFREMVWGTYHENRGTLLMSY